MFINPISVNHRSNTPAFQKGLNPEVAKNQYRILLTQDIWAEKLKIKRPENLMEKEILFEVLQNRLKLDRFARLNNAFAKLKLKISKINDLMEQDPTNPEIPAMIDELKKHGNIESVYKTLQKQIQQEAIKNKPAMDYFKNIEKLEDEYLDKHLIKYSKMEKFWQQIEKHNINKDNQYSTKELLEILSKETAPAAKTVVQPLTRKQLLDKMTVQYENILLEKINIYSKTENHNQEAYNAKKLLAEQNLADLKRFPEIAKQVGKMCTFIESKISHKAEQLGNIDIYPIGIIFDDMKLFEHDIKKITKEISILKNKISQSPEDQTLQTKLQEFETLLNDMKNGWKKGLKYLIEYEQTNHQRMIDGGRKAEYEYLTDKCKELNKYKGFYQIMNDSQGEIPEKVWTEML